MASKSRHKSCAACIQTKRKCDRSIPRCQRCIARGTICQYVGRSQSQRRRPPSLDEAQPIPFTAHDSDSRWRMKGNQIDLLDQFTSCTDASSFEFTNHPFNLAGMSDDGGFIYDDLQDLLPQLRPGGQPTAFDVRPSQSDFVLQPRVDFVAKRLMRAPRTFIEQGQTVFIHRTQLQDHCNSALPDAMSVCALYCMKTAANQSLVFQQLQRNCRQLIANTDTLHTSNSNLLAATQALLLYQVIRLFDGDIRLRADAEADELVSISWASRLQASVSDLSHMEAESKQSFTVAMPTLESSADWLTWAMQESIRRTFIFAHMLKGIFSFLKIGHDSGIDLHGFHYFTAQAALWEAQSEVGWYRAQLDLERLEMRISQWEDTIKVARPHDLEELTVLIMVMMWGVEATRTWLGQEYSMRYGLDTASHQPYQLLSWHDHFEV